MVTVTGQYQGPWLELEHLDIETPTQMIQMTSKLWLNVVRGEVSSNRRGVGQV